MAQCPQDTAQVGFVHVALQAHQRAGNFQLDAAGRSRRLVLGRWVRDRSDDLAGQQLGLELNGQQYRRFGIDLRAQCVAPPLEQQVSVDAVLQRDRRHGGARLLAQLHQVPLELPIVLPANAPGDLARLSLHGVHHLLLLHTISWACTCSAGMLATTRRSRKDGAERTITFQVCVFLGTHDSVVCDAKLIVHPFSRITTIPNVTRRFGDVYVPLPC